MKDIIDERDGIGDEMASKKMEPTFTVKNFAAIEEIIDFPLNNLTSVS